MATRAEWGELNFFELQIDVMEKGMESFDARLKKVPKKLRGLRPFGLVEQAVAAVESLPLIQSLKGDAMRERHWKKVVEITGGEREIDPKTLTLNELFAMNLEKYEEQILEVCSGAGKELNIENGIKAIAETWRLQRFDVVKYMKGTQERGLILRSTDEIQALDDNEVALQNMMGNRFVGFFELIGKWKGKLMSTVRAVIEVMDEGAARVVLARGDLPRSEDIREQLPEDAKRFDGIDAPSRSRWRTPHKNPNPMEAARSTAASKPSGLLSSSTCARSSLSDYLETKRKKFPRFYFISDDDLLQILGTSDSTAVQEHMLKLFDNVKRSSGRWKRRRQAPRIAGHGVVDGRAVPYPRRSRRPRAWSRTGCRWLESEHQDERSAGS